MPGCEKIVNFFCLEGNNTSNEATTQTTDSYVKSSSHYHLTNWISTKENYNSSDQKGYYLNKKLSEINAIKTPENDSSFGIITYPL